MQSQNTKQKKTVFCLNSVGRAGWTTFPSMPMSHVSSQALPLIFIPEAVSPGPVRARFAECYCQVIKTSCCLLLLSFLIPLSVSQSVSFITVLVQIKHYHSSKCFLYLSSEAVLYCSTFVLSNTIYTNLVGRSTAAPPQVLRSSTIWSLKKIWVWLGWSLGSFMQTRCSNKPGFAIPHPCKESFFFLNTFFFFWQGIKEASSPSLSRNTWQPILQPR